MPGPIDTVNDLVEAINSADIERALALYENGAVMAAQPGQLARGRAELRQALAGFIALKPVLRSQAQYEIEAEGVALCIGRWSLSGTDPAGNAVVMNGESTDVLRRQADGRWLIAIDNPWGTQVLPPR